MSNTLALLDKARDLCTPQTDYRLAQVLGISQQTISSCRTHGKTLSPLAAHALSKFLEQDYEAVMALIELDREKHPKRRAYWEKIAPRMVPSLVIGLLATAGLGVSEPSHTAQVDGKLTFNTVYILRSRTRLLRILTSRFVRRTLLPQLVPA